MVRLSSHSHVLQPARGGGLLRTLVSAVWQPALDVTAFQRPEQLLLRDAAPILAQSLRIGKLRLSVFICPACPSPEISCLSALAHTDVHYIGIDLVRRPLHDLYEVLYAEPFLLDVA